MRILSSFTDYYDYGVAQYGHQDADHTELRKVYTRNTTVYAKPHSNLGEEHLDVKDAPASLLHLQTRLDHLPGFSQRARHLWGADQKNKSEAFKKETLSLSPMWFIVGGQALKAVWVFHARKKPGVASPVQHYRMSGHDHGVRSVPYYHPHTERTQGESRVTQLQQQYDVLTNRPVFTQEDFEHAVGPEWAQVLSSKKGHSAWKYRMQREHFPDEDQVHQPMQLGQWLARPGPDMYQALLDDQVMTALVKSTAVVVDPRLQDWQLQLHYDPHTCMQAMDMYIGNLVAEPERKALENSNAQMTDVLKAAQHGFNDASFRKQPTKHGVPARAKRPHPDNVITADAPVAPVASSDSFSP